MRTVRVVDADARPLEGALVLTMQRGRNPYRRTDPTGRCQVPARDIVLTVRAPGFVDVDHWVGRQEGAEEVIRLERRTGTQRGRCFDSAGRPLAGVPVEVEEWAWCPKASVITDLHGRFQHDRVHTGRVVLSVDTPAWWAPLRFVYPPEPEVALTVFRRTTISGRVEIVSDDPDEGGWLYVEDCESGVSLTSKHPTFDLPVPPGRVTLALLVDDVPHRLGTFVLAEGERRTNVELRVPLPSAPHAGPSESQAWIEIDEAEIGTRLWLTGLFRDGVRPLNRPASGARWTLGRGDLLGLGVQTRASSWVQVAGAGDRTRLLRPQMGAVGVRLRSRRGAWLQQGFIGLRWSGREGPPFRLGVPQRDRDGTAPPGTFTLGGVGPGSYDVLWVRRRPEASVLLHQDFQMPAPAQNVDLGIVTLPAPASLEATVLDLEGRIVPGAVVRLATGSRVHFRRADADGRATFEVTDPTRIEAVAWDDRVALPGRALRVQIRHEQ